MSVQAVRSVMSEVSMECTTCLFCGGTGGEVVASGTDYDYETTDQLFHFVECEHCGHVYLNPRPVVDAADVTCPGHYYTQALSKGGMGRLLLGQIRDFLYRRIARLFTSVPRGTAWLEFGAGDGAFVHRCQTTTSGYAGGGP